MFLMQWHQGAYRDAFLDYVRDAYRGRIKRGTGRKLQDRLGQKYSTLDGQFLAFLKDGQTRRRRVSQPKASRKRGGPSGRFPASECTLFRQAKSLTD